MSLNAAKYPELVARIAAEGHEIANHTHDHLWLDSAAANVIAEQIRSAEEIIEGYSAGRWFRPPRGWTNHEVAREARDQGLRSVFWSGSFEGHQAKGVAEATRIVVEDASPGAIILCHDGGRLDGPNPQDVDRSRTVEALPGILSGLLAKQLSPVSLTRLIGPQ
ncbi:MAG: polysaccharide deacetylase family protein [Tetrasphaera sp.]